MVRDWLYTEPHGPPVAAVTTQLDAAEVVVGGDVGGTDVVGAVVVGTAVVVTVGFSGTVEQLYTGRALTFAPEAIATLKPELLNEPPGAIAPSTRSSSGVT